MRETDYNIAIAICLLKDDYQLTNNLLEQNTHGLYVSVKGLHDSEYFWHCHLLKA